jgi:hypothetical protein
MLEMSIPVVVFGHNFTATSIHRGLDRSALRVRQRAFHRQRVPGAPQMDQHQRRATDVHAPLSQVIV